MKRILFCGLLAIIAITVNAMPPIEEGKAIFTARCASCHSVNKPLTGPALAGVDTRRTPDWIVQFVQSSQSLVQAGDPQAVALFEQFNKIPMPDHKDLTAANIESIVGYIKAEAASASATPAMKKLSKIRPAYLPLSIQKDYAFFIGFLVAVALLIFVLLFFVRLKEYERHAKGTRDA